MDSFTEYPDVAHDYPPEVVEYLKRRWEDENPPPKAVDISRHDLQTFTPVGVFFFAIAFTLFGMACMYFAIKM
jgi:hypothetical protein